MGLGAAVAGAVAGAFLCSPTALGGPLYAACVGGVTAASGLVGLGGAYLFAVAEVQALETFIADLDVANNLARKSVDVVGPNFSKPGTKVTVGIYVDGKLFKSVTMNARLWQKISWLLYQAKIKWEKRQRR